MTHSKVCAQCGIEKPLNDFYKQTVGGYHTKCKPCMREIQNRKYAVRTGKMTEEEAALGMTPAVPKKSREEVQADYLRNIKKWQKDNKHRITYSVSLARFGPATPAWADKEAMIAFYKEARDKTEETGILHEVDHIVPMTHPEVCGLHNQFNLQVTTRKENRSKGNREWPDRGSAPLSLAEQAKAQKARWARLEEKSCREWEEEQKNGQR